uniref:Uncharacterized protein n=1 Tax=viral metagenome TaxID=1070528 RepID=A0A6C0BAJ1_9ZZZZ
MSCCKETNNSIAIPLYSLKNKYNKLKDYNKIIIKMNIFKIKNEPKQSQFKKKEIKIDTSDSSLFPELSSYKNIENQNQNQNQICLDFLSASNTVSENKSEEEEEKIILKPGWVLLTKNKTDNTTQWKVSPEIEEFKLQIEINEKKEAISDMISTWQKFKREYEEIYGEEAYIYNYTKNSLSDEYDEYEYE